MKSQNHTRSSDQGGVYSCQLSVFSKLPNSHTPTLPNFSTSRFKKGFTLIEILVVVVIVAILMGGTFRLMGIASESSKRADTVSRLERIHNALGAYYAEYGQYPPSATVNKNSTTPKYVALETRFKMPVPSGSPYAGKGVETDPPSDMVFGLPGYLIPKITAMYKGTDTGTSGEAEAEDRYLPEKTKMYLNSIGSLGGWGDVTSWKTAYSIEQQDPRTQVCNRWLPQIAGILEPGLDSQPYSADLDSGTPYIYRIFRDGWRREFVYECRPPFQSYRLWSLGADNRTYFQRYYDSTDGDSTSAQVFAIGGNGALTLSQKLTAYSSNSDCNTDDIEMTDR